MKPELQRIAIAEACGWEIDQERKTHGFKPLTDGCRTYTQLPDYCNDLNAMHEAEKLIMVGHIGYCRAVLDLVCPETKGVIVGLHAGYGLCIMHANAEQRAEAFLRTLELWKD